MAKRDSLITSSTYRSNGTVLLETQGRHRRSGRSGHGLTNILCPILVSGRGRVCIGARRPRARGLPRSFVRSQLHAATRSYSWSQDSCTARDSSKDRAREQRRYGEPYLSLMATSLALATSPYQKNKIIIFSACAPQWVWLEKSGRG